LLKLVLKLFVVCC